MDVQSGDIGLGSTQLVSLVEAREEAARLRRMARGGGDPLAERRRERQKMLSFKKAGEKVHASHAETFRNQKHKAQWLASLGAYIFPAFGTRAVDSIDSSDVLKALAWTLLRDEKQLRSCFVCHEAIKDRDYVFTKYAK